jgi:GH35 family endo-1,4-beta-xylanase
MQQALARRYAELFGVYLKHHGTLTRVSFWGVTDEDSWLNKCPSRAERTIRCSSIATIGPSRCSMPSFMRHGRSESRQ